VPVADVLEPTGSEDLDARIRMGLECGQQALSETLSEIRLLRQGIEVYTALRGSRRDGKQQRDGSHFMSIAQAVYRRMKSRSPSRKSKAERR
jgi:hypothetical protein